MSDGRAHKGEGHRGRLREKFLTSSLTGFHDYEVIELLLTLGTPRKDCKEAAKAALERFESFQAVLESTPKQLCEIKGIGPKNLFGIKLAKAVADRYFKKRVFEKDPLSNSKDLYEYLSAELAHQARLPHTQLGVKILREAIRAAK